MLARTRSAVWLAAILAFATVASIASRMLLSDFLPLMAAPRSALVVAGIGNACSPSVALIASTCVRTASQPAMTSSPFRFSFSAFTSLSSSRRTRRVSADTSSIVRNTASMSAVCASTASFVAARRSSTPLHHFTVSSALAKSSSVCRFRLMLLSTESAPALKSARLLAVTMPVTSTRSAGSWSGARPVGTGAAGASGT